MAKIIKITKSSWQLGWIDGLERKVSRNLVDGVDSEAYWRGIQRAGEFIKRISVSKDETVLMEFERHRAMLCKKHKQ